MIMKPKIIVILGPTTSGKSALAVHDFKHKAEKAIEGILRKNKLPIICGGTGFYIQALVDNISYPEVPPNPALRKRLKDKSTAELFKILKKLDPKRAKNIDAKNPHRLLRAIEIAQALGEVPTLSSQKKYNSLRLGIRTDDNILKQKIHDRLMARMKKGMIKEVERLHKSGLGWKRLEELGLEYRYIAYFLQKKITRQEMLGTLEKEIWHYAKRQKTWFKRDKSITWFDIQKANEVKKIEKEVNTFIASK
jgi:tRNA dimethylallyltransferase